MKSCIIYHSHSGKTKRVVEQVHQALGGVIIPVTPQKPYTSLSVVPVGCYRALRRSADPVTPRTIDVSDSDLIIIASPVWAGRPSPVINGAVAGITGIKEKKTFLIVTCNETKSGNDALIPFREILESKGCSVCGAAVLDRHHVTDSATISDLIGDIRSAGIV